MRVEAISGERSSGARSRIYKAAVRIFAENGASEVNVSDLANAAGIARGTIYNNIKDPENLFGEVASALSHEMLVRTEATMRDLSDPAERIATGLRLFVRRAHEEHDWGRFLVRFSLSHTALRGMMSEPPARDIRSAMASGRFKNDEAKLPVLVTMLAGTTMAAMNAIIRGDQAWREAGSATAELFLRAGGLSTAEARRLSRTELQPLAPLPPPSARAIKRKKP
jgi:AcrR family transcriptional regulator